MARLDLDEALTLFHRVRRAFSTAAAPQWAHLDLTMAQLKVLFVLHEEGGLPVSALAQRLGGKLPAVSLLVDRLVHAGLVRRSHDQIDRRRVLLELTPKALQLTRRLNEGTSPVRSWLSEMSAEGLHALVRGMDELATVIETRAQKRRAS